ncbi:hypothetical protein LSTR_LSTR006462 [Laodelphax striatellus]|uniref:Uncharacterized protein n=1 Tax=Laodelphax striatellus TaxID=195883 RepID=A0A482WX46_LAOST|nr:hypothetical protein LSTR_LSTR006462 [Laodelphax striatellus]
MRLVVAIATTAALLGCSMRTALAYRTRPGIILVALFNFKLFNTFHLLFALSSELSVLEIEGKIVKQNVDEFITLEAEKLSH